MEKLVIINRALGATGNNKLNQLADPDFLDEWDAANEGFGIAIDDLGSRHKWPFAKKIAAMVPAAEADNPSERFDFAYLQPTEALHVVAVLYNGHPMETGYEILGRYVCANLSSGLSLLYIWAPPDANWHPQAAVIIQLLTEAHILRELNEDFGEADKREARAEVRLFEARATVGQQEPARNLFRSGIAAARRRRRG